MFRCINATFCFEHFCNVCKMKVDILQMYMEDKQNKPNKNKTMQLIYFMANITTTFIIVYRFLNCPKCIAHNNFTNYTYVKAQHFISLFFY